MSARTSSSSGWEDSQLAWAWSYLRPYRRRIAALASLSVLEIVLRVLAPWALAVVVDHALGSERLGATLTGWLDALGFGSERKDILVLFVCLGFGMQLLHQLVMMLHGRLSVAIGQTLIRDLREQQFAHVQTLTLRHHLATPAGDSVQRLESDTRCLEQLVLRGLFPVVFSVLTLVIMFVILLTIDLPLALLALAIVPPLYLWLRFYARRMAPSADHARRTDSRLISRVFEALTSIRLIESHAREDHELARFSCVASDAAEAWIHVGRQGTVFAIVNGALTVIGSSLILLVGGYAVLDGRISVGTLLLVLAYLASVYGPLSAIAHTTSDLQHAFASARRVRSVRDTVPEAHDVAGAIAADGIRGEVRFEEVSFAYGDGPAVLDRVTLAANPGDVIALVGPSGAGKSTLASMLLRLAGLSGGQRQRLSIARAFLRNAPILILDEPTAALDTIAEEEVVEAVHALWSGRTTFVVAHRLSTVMDATRILVMEHGRIVASGTHDELRQSSPLYRQLCAQLVEPSERSPYVASPPAAL